MENKNISSNEEINETPKASPCETQTESVARKRDKKAAKKRLKKVLTIVIAAFLVLGILCGALYLILKYAFPPEAPYGYDDKYFFPADYSKNIFHDERYMGKNRNVYYDHYGNIYTLTEENVDTLPGSARFLYDYINCIIEGRCDEYSGYFTSEYISSNESQVSKNLTIPLYTEFTMQGLYDIKIKRINNENSTADGDYNVERYLISYRIFENNGTFRRDILDESRELLYTVYTNGTLTKINDIDFNQVK